MFPKAYPNRRKIPEGTSLPAGSGWTDLLPKAMAGRWPKLKHSACCGVFFPYRLQNLSLLIKVNIISNRTDPHCITGSTDVVPDTSLFISLKCGKVEEISRPVSLSSSRPHSLGAPHIPTQDGSVAFSSPGLVPQRGVSALKLGLEMQMVQVW